MTGRIGCVRSSAWIWDFSSTDTTTAPSGGSRYKPTTSRILASSRGSVENLNVSTRCGWMSHLRQILATVENEVPKGLASSRDDQCVTPSPAGGLPPFDNVATTTSISSTSAGRPDPFWSPKPAMPARSYRSRQETTVAPATPPTPPPPPPPRQEPPAARDPPPTTAISVLGSPSAASNTIRARLTSPAGADDDRVNDSSRPRSPSPNTNGAAT